MVHSANPHGHQPQPAFFWPSPIRSCGALAGLCSPVRGSSPKAQPLSISQHSHPFDMFTIIYLIFFLFPFGMFSCGHAHEGYRPPTARVMNTPINSELTVCAYGENTGPPLAALRFVGCANYRCQAVQCTPRTCTPCPFPPPPLATSVLPGSVNSLLVLDSTCKR